MLKRMLKVLRPKTTNQPPSQGLSKGGSHCVKHYRHGVFATEYCRLFTSKKAYKEGVTSTKGPTPPPPKLRPCQCNVIYKSLHYVHGITLPKPKDHLAPQERNIPEMQNNVLKVRTLQNMHGFLIIKLSLTMPQSLTKETIASKTHCSHGTRLKLSRLTTTPARYRDNITLF